MPTVTRKVPPHWQHPRDANGRHIPLVDGTKYEWKVRHWDEEEEKWREGLRCEGMTYAEFNGSRPDPKNYTPQWSPSECTHWQYYEEVTDGTPISPVCGSAEELAHWLLKHDPGLAVDGKSLRPSTYPEILSVILQRPLVRD